VQIEFDSEKDASDIELRGISLEDAVRFDWHSAFITPDTRRDYGEVRYRAFGFIDDRLHALVFTPREGKMRVLSLREANQREVLRYEKKIQG
jgi:uncharacterized protein